MVVIQVVMLKDFENSVFSGFYSMYIFWPIIKIFITLNAKKMPMKSAAQKHSTNSDRGVLSLGPSFSLVNALVYVELEHFILIIFY